MCWTLFSKRKRYELNLRQWLSGNEHQVQAREALLIREFDSFVGGGGEGVDGPTHSGFCDQLATFFFRHGRAWPRSVKIRRYISYCG